MRDAFYAHLKDWISCEQAFVFIHIPRKTVGKRFDFLEESDRRIECQSTNAEIRSHHSLSADHLENAQNVFALAKAIKKYSHRTQVHRVRSQPDQMRVDARNFTQQYAHPLRSWRNLQPQQLLYCQAVREIVDHRAEVIDSIGKRHDLLVK